MAIKFNGIRVSGDERIGEKYIIIGDSYTTGTTSKTFSSTGKTTPWVEYLRQKLGISTSNWINKGVGGQGFTTGSTSSPNANYLGQLSGVADDSRVTDILIGGGINDRDASYDTLYSKMAEFQSYAAEHFPNARLTFAYTSNSCDPQYRYAVIRTLHRFQKACAMLGIPMLSGCEYALREYDDCFYSDDLVHPIDYGYKMLAQYAYNAMMGYGNTCCISTVLTVIEPAGNVTSIEEASMGAMIKGDVLHFFSIGKMSFKLNSLNVGNASGGEPYIHLANIKSGLVTGAGEGDDFKHDVNIIDINAIIKNGDVWHNVPCRLSIINKKLLLYPFSADTDGEGYLNLNNVTDVQIAKFSTTFFSLMC